eukprot:TRINITY_DN13087_c0_g1_i1.p1 TRINITY_DN13087_c0_g1~~TRINITY_DN13087_c0_g1_i1.p1  ORF type:complete len:431 (-),score=37.06 TRINITY_DN13087_c0_g1_i1:79-1371(-)
MISMHVVSIILFCMICCASSQLVIFEPSVVEGNYETAQLLLHRENISEGYNGTLIYTGDPSLRSSWPDVNGKIVLTSLFVPPEDILRDMQQRGAIAVIMQGFSGVPGFIQYATNNGDTSDITIDFVELEETQYAFITSNIELYSIMPVEIQFEQNQWQPVFESGWLYVVQITLGLFEIANIVLGIIRLRAFVHRDEGIAFNIPQVSLVIDLAANLLRLSYAPDIGGMRRLYNRNANIVMLLISVPFTLTPSLMITFFWHEILASNKIDVNSGIKKLKIPFIVTSVCLFVLEIIVNILRCLPLGLTNIMLYVDSIIYTIVGLSIGVFYVVTAVRVIRRVKNSERLKDRYTARTSLRIGFTSFGLLLSAISTALAIFMLQFPEGYMFDIWLGHAALNTVSLCNILAFAVPPSFQSTSKKTNSVPTTGTHTDM